MNVLQDQRECGLAFVVVTATVIHRASRWIKKESAIVSLAIVVASGAESEWASQDQQRRREFPPSVTGIDQWRIKRREIRAPFVKLSFKSPKSGIGAEAV